MQKRFYAQKDNIAKSAKTGAKYGGIIGLGIGGGVGVANYVVGNLFNQVIIPAATTFYSKWDLCKSQEGPYVPLSKSVAKHSLATAAVFALAGSAGGSIYGFFKRSQPIGGINRAERSITENRKHPFAP